MKTTISILITLFFVAGCGVLTPPDPVPRESSYYWHKEQRVQDKILADEPEKRGDFGTSNVPEKRGDFGTSSVPE